MNSISGVQQQHTKSALTPILDFFLPSEVATIQQMMVQHISWSQGRSTSLHNSESILQTSTLVWTVPDKWQYYCGNVSLEWIDSTYDNFQINSISNHSITHHMASYNIHEALDLISDNFSILLHSMFQPHPFLPTDKTQVLFCAPNLF